ncbi:exsB protein [Methanothermus fervidus DSM 2088]|uniref:7-cyano-7-deazaguanine synthase n=1 Tax=Methanothermus fervidus (strain ATCC 43054 / DSM 2088 / JCM 10308 / V24 S) TaxID=523846 RepID=E3GY05_METFV|nr:7-cyano-7-deazaguanine synthase QueC [Methanothermus fervidus]ADP77187.1 exsB protein [Methanothermus fervidus DSM 2088]
MVKAPRAISILSGGLDSVVALFDFIKKNPNGEVHAITFDYGQKSAEMEINASKKICKYLGIKHSVLNVKWLGKLGTSALTTDKEIPKLKISDLEDKEKCEKTAKMVWVPARNIVFTAIASAFAEAENAEKIIVGWDREEASTFPDNSKEFLSAFNNLLAIGTMSNINIEAPLIDMDKHEIVKLGKKYGVPFEFTYSCYQGFEKHCGVCESCVRRKRAFKLAKVEDPTEYMK